MKTLLTEQDLQEGVQRLATEVAACFDGRPLTIVGVLTGSVVLLADLIRQLDMPMRVGVIQARSYHGATTERSSDKRLSGRRQFPRRGAAPGALLLCS